MIRLGQVLAVTTGLAMADFSFAQDAGFQHLPVVYWRGRVVDSTGAPVRHTWVSVALAGPPTRGGLRPRLVEVGPDDSANAASANRAVGDASRTFAAAADGTFAIPMLSGQAYDIRIQAPAFEWFETSRAVHPPVKVTLRRPIALRGRVRGAVLLGARHLVVRLEPVHDDARFPFLTVATLVQADGRFEMPAVVHPDALLTCEYESEEGAGWLAHGVYRRIRVPQAPAELDLRLDGPERDVTDFLIGTHRLDIESGDEGHGVPEVDYGYPPGTDPENPKEQIKR